MYKFIFKLIFLNLIFGHNLYAQKKIIYGRDNRHEAFEYADSRFRELSKSVAGKVLNYKLFKKGTHYFYKKHKYSQRLFHYKPFPESKRVRMCQNEKFGEQPVLPSCTGFLIAPNTLITAGHCVKNKIDCRDSKWVFGFNGDEKIPASNVYKCKKIIGQKLTLGIFSTKDYAIIELDRKVSNRTPLKFKRSGKIKKETQLVIIGHPSGLPLKIIDHAKVRKRRINFFYTNSDTFGGDSGAPVFDKKTGLVLGILIEGGKDFVYNKSGNCMESHRVSNYNGKEKILKIQKIKELKTF